MHQKSLKALFHTPLQLLLLLRRNHNVSFFQATTESPWVVSSADKLRYDGIFKQADKDGDGLVSGIGFTL